MLQFFGIPTNAPKLREFLEAGSPGDIRKVALEERPMPTTQLMISAMEELARKKDRSAAPILIDTARGQFTPGQRAMVNYDIQSVSRSLQEQRKNVMYEYLRYNAVNSLGLIGDIRGLPVVQEVFEESKSGLFKINATLALASLDSRGGIPYLVEQVGEKDRHLAVAATDALSMITGMELDYDSNTPIVRRKRTIEKVEKWWKENREVFTPDGERIRKRRLNPPAPTPVLLRSVRDLIRAAGSLGRIEPTLPGKEESPESAGTPRFIEAREKLTAMGSTILPQLVPLCLDPEEDLDIRMEALRRYARMASIDEARELLKQVRKDKNPEVENLAKNLLKQLKEREQ